MISESKYPHPLDIIILDSENGVDYRKLCDLLKTGQWREADQETIQVMLKAANRVNERWFNSESLQKFPCKDLRTIDQLWMTASNDHFGFSIQKKIWEDCGSAISPGKNWDRFCIRVGWKDKQTNDDVSYFDLSFNPSLAPKGELPGGFGLGWFGFDWIDSWNPGEDGGFLGLEFVSSLSQRLMNCSIEPALIHL
jgi:GUN4-like